MKFLIYLVLIIVALVNNFYLCNGEAVISFKTFQYDQYRCRGDSGSSLGPLSTGSFNMDEIELGNTDGANSQSNSYSSSVVDCDNIEIETEAFIVIGACIPYDNYNYYFLVYRVDYTNGTISKTTYSDDQCTEINTFNPVKHYKIDECVESCTSSGPYLYTIIDSAEIVIPKNTLVQFDYTGACSCCWKETFTQIIYTPINKCLLTSESTSYQVSCNTTSQQYQVYNSVNQNNCLRYQQETVHDLGVQYCENSNQMMFCNV